ncbi:hypothetical protein ASF28_13190 [Methylobacterium sp. Leaf99]|uniref:DUF6460 domain-containing protein n=1 Tax=Methylobacterium sp. Leaf99 TaxID=1736251 RepID=UPI0006F32CEE|nr:DUF6460 domain-containing protein [Methylobacterium sp. Leaf99]KQP08039.1 hypothetical protein ASF28_13190 [Methylobacterium sp. Leaf99]
MSIDNDPRRPQPFPGQPYAGGYAEPARRSTLRRFLGGSPAAVFAKLLFLSILVGAVMAMLGVTPGLLFWHAYDAVRALVDLGLDTFHDFGRWILAGAVVVVPLWLLSRFFAVSK